MRTEANIKTHYIKGKVVVHFLSILTESEIKECELKAQKNGDIFTIDTKYKFAVNKANKFGGRKFHNKSFGGGIAFENEQQLERFISKEVESSSLAALEKVNRYFIDLQNRCILTPKEESVWASVSYALESAKGNI